MERISAIIIVNGNFKNTGFGFSCMQQAIVLEIEGTFEYICEDEVRITVSGNLKSIEKMQSWCEQQAITTKVSITFSEGDPTHQHGFEILNLLENTEEKNRILNVKKHIPKE